MEGKIEWITLFFSTSLRVCVFPPLILPLPSFPPSSPPPPLSSLPEYIMQLDTKTLFTSVL